MKRIKARYRLCVSAVWALWLILTAAAWLSVLQPQNQVYSEVHKELRIRTDELDLARTASLESTRRRQIEALEETLEELERFTVGPRQQDRLALEVSRLAGELNLEGYAGESCGNIEKSFQTDSKTPIERRFLDVTFAGPFERFAQFINALERNTPVLFIQNVSVVRASDGSRRHEARLLLSMLIQKEPIAIPETARDSILRRRPEEDSWFDVCLIDGSSSLSLRRIRPAETPSAGKPILTYAPGSSGAREYQCLADELNHELQIRTSQTNLVHL